MTDTNLVDVMGLSGDDFTAPASGSNFRTSLAVAAQQPKAARLTDVNLVDATGLTPDLVAANRDTIQKDREQQRIMGDIQSIKEHSPLGRWLNDNANGALAVDNIGWFRSMESILSSAGREMQRAETDTRLNRLAAYEALTGPLNETDAAEKARLEAQASGIAPGEWTGSLFSDAVISAAQIIPSLMDTLKQSAKGLVTGAGAGAAVGGVPGAIAGSVLGSAAGAIESTSMVNFGSLLRDFSSLTDENGTPLDPETAKIAALIATVPIAALDRLSFGVVSKVVPGARGIQQLVAKYGIKEAIKIPTVRAAIAKGARDYFTAVATEGGTEGVQQAIQAMARYVVDPDQTKQFDGGAIIAEAGDAAYTATLGVGLIGLPGSISTTSRAVQDASRARTAPETEAHVNLVHEAMQKPEAQEMLKASPERMRSFSLASDGNQKYHIAAEPMLQLFQTLPDADRSRLLEAIPELESQLEEAAAADTDIIMRRGDYASLFASQPWSAPLIPHVRERAEDVSAADIRALTENPINLDAPENLETPEPPADTLERQVSDVLATGARLAPRHAKTDAKHMAASLRALERGYALLGETVTPEQILNTIKFTREGFQYAEPERITEAKQDLLNIQARIGKGMPKATSAAEQKSVMPALSYIVESKGRLDPESVIGKELAQMGVTPKTHGWAFKKGGFKGADVIELSDFNAALPQYTLQGESIGSDTTVTTGYVPLDALVGILSNEASARAEAPPKEGRAGREDNLEDFLTNERGLNLSLQEVAALTPEKLQTLMAEYQAAQEQAEQTPAAVLDDATELFQSYGQESGISLEEAQAQLAAVQDVRDGQGRLLAANGKPSKLNERQWRVVRTPAFKAWFGDWENDPKNASKVVDENGEPLVVYHGTNADIAAFDMNLAGKSSQTGDSGASFFTDNATNAASYAGMHGVIYQVYLKIVNPEIIDASGENWLKVSKDTSGNNMDINQSAQNAYGNGKDGLIVGDVLDTAEALYGQYNRDIVADAHRKILLKDHDDALAELDKRKNSPTGKKEMKDMMNYSKWPEVKRLISAQKALADNMRGTSFAVFSPTQIKSIHNRGTFDPQDARILFQSAYHGSPYRFDKFTTDAMGTGEGVQAFGWGLYFSGKKEVADFYRKNLSSEQEYLLVGSDGEAVPWQDLARELYVEEDANGDYNDLDGFNWAFRNLSEQGEFHTHPDKDTDFYRGYDFAKRLIEEGGITRQEIGQLYEVSIPEDDTLLLWDKPMSEQSEKVLAALRGAATSEDLVSSIRDNEDGEAFYRLLSREKGSDEAASRYLNSLGINGIKYLDGSSRGAGDGSYNYVIFDDSAIEIVNTFYQQNRGSIVYDNALKNVVISLTSGADFSTMVHEYGGHYLSLAHRQLAERARDRLASGDITDASTIEALQDMVMKWEKLKEWASTGAARHHRLSPEAIKLVDGAVPDAMTDELRKVAMAHGYRPERVGDLTPQGLVEYLKMVAFEESIADAMVQYFKEGKAPSEDLRDTFALYAAWLADIFKSVVRTALGKKINDDVRETFASWFATSEEIAAARSSHVQIEQIAAQMDKLGVAPDKGVVAEVARLLNKGGTKARDLLLSEVALEEKKKQTAEYKADYEKTLKEVTDSVGANKVYAVQDYILAGHKLDAKLVEAAVGKEIAKRLPNGLRGGSANPNMIAGIFGFVDGADMLRAIVSNLPKKAFITQETKRLMLERYGNPLEDGRAGERAKILVETDEVGEALAYLISASGHKAATRRLVKAAAKQRMLNTTYEQMEPTKYASSRDKALRAAYAATAKGDAGRAAQYLQTAMLNHELLMAANAMKESHAKALKLYAKVNRKDTALPATWEGEYVYFARYLLSRVGLSTNKNFDPAKWMQEAQGRNPELLNQLIAGVNPDVVPAKNWESLTNAQLLTLYDVVKNTIHVGRENKAFRRGEEKLTIDQAMAEIKGRLAAQNYHVEQPPLDSSFTNAQKVARVLGGMEAALVRIEHLCKHLDGGDAFGPMSQSIFRPISDAVNKGKPKSKMFIEKLAKLMDTKEAEYSNSGSIMVADLASPVFKGTFRTKWDLVVCALNYGNESSAKKLLEGYKWSDGALLAAFQTHLNESDLEFVQQVWDILNEIKPYVKDEYYERTGLSLVEVEPRAFDMFGRTWRGGYYPVVYSRAHVANSRVFGKEATDESLFGAQGSGWPSPPKGATIERTDYVGPISLDPLVAIRHAEQSIHRWAVSRAIRQTARLVNRPDFKSAMAAINPAYTDLFMPWLRAIARDTVDDAAASDWDKTAKILRHRTTVVIMGLNLRNAMQNLSGYPLVMNEIGGKYFLNGLDTFRKSPTESTDFIFERSPEMALRYQNLDRDQQEVLRTIAAGKRSVVGKAARSIEPYAFALSNAMDALVARPAWLGAYKKAIAEDKSEADAVYYADHVVRTTVGIGSVKDVAAIQRGNQYARTTLAMFYSYMSMVYNLNRSQFLTLKRQGVKNIPAFLAGQMMVNVIPNLMAAGIVDALGGGGGDADGEDWLWWYARRVMSGMFGLVPLAGDVGEALVDVLSGDRAFDRFQNPVFSTLATAGKAAGGVRDMVVDDDPNYDKIAEGLVTTMAFITGIPMNDMRHPIGALVDWAEGDSGPQGLWDAFQQLLGAPPVEE